MTVSVCLDILKSTNGTRKSCTISRPEEPAVPICYIKHYHQALVPINQASKQALPSHSYPFQSYRPHTEHWDLENLLLSEHRKTRRAEILHRSRLKRSHISPVMTQNSTIFLNSKSPFELFQTKTNPSGLLQAGIHICVIS